MNRHIKRYEIKRPFLETLNGYIEATKCRTLDTFTQNDKYITPQIEI